MAADRAMTAAQDTTRLRSPLTVRLDEIVVTSMSQANQLAGCYRVPRETVAGGAALGSVGAAATEQRDARARSASPAQRREFSLAPAAAPLLRLDTSSFMGGFRVKPQAGDSTVGWWTQASADSLSVRFLDGTRATVARSRRVDCP